MKLFTWLDIRRTISRETSYGSKLPEGVVRIRCFSDAVEIGLLGEEHKQNAKNALKQWFKDWYEEDESIIYLTLGNATLPIEFIPGEEPLNKNISVRPFWEEISYVEVESEDKVVPSEIIKLPEPFTDKPNLVAFYSFKGGVGRTLNLAAYIFALLDRAKEINQPIKLLVIDADLEAPGLTYWNRSEKQQPTACFIDFLEAYHYSPINQEETLSLLAKEIKKSPKEEGKSTLYFLPACLDDEQLLDTPILPEHLVKSPDGTWECGNAIHRLGKAVGVDYVLIDLRAGLSEISSPIIFDPRIQRFLVTTINDQSVKGTSLVLEQIGRVAPPEPIDDESYYDASLLISMLTPELKSLPAFEEALVEFQSAYVQPQEDNLYSSRLEIKENYFAQELLYVNSWEEARSKLSSTSVMNVAAYWAQRELLASKNLKIKPKTETEKSTLLEEVRKLRDVCQRYEYAEAGQGEDLLVTEPLQNLATNFKNQLPRVVSIGAKGAGKTFNYIQLSRFRYWENFLARINNTEPESNQKTYIFPLLQSGNLQDKALNIIHQARESVKEVWGDLPNFKHSDYVDRIKKAVSEENWSEPQWTEFWVTQIAASIGMSTDTSPSISNINSYLKNNGLRVIFIFDGLEDIFPNIASNDKEKIALKSLIDDLPSRLSEIRELKIGVIIFLRRDFLRYTISQNLKQFESLYRAYDLSWEQDSFLRLVFWICGQAEVINASEENIQTLSTEEIKERLEELWGKRLGSDKSKEAYTASWVYAALTDFNGRLQARDIVRLLYHAANITVDKSQEVQFAKWSTSRLLPPQAIRRSLQPCSKAKVDEAKEEYILFKRWVEDTLQLHPPAQRRIPFDVQQFNMEPQTVRTLEEMGVIYEDKEKEDSARFYMPEIFREGLDFSAKGARPRVLALKRKILGRGIL